MLFNSIEFAIFLTIVLLFYWSFFSRNLKLQNTFMAFPEGPVDAGDGIWSWWEDGPQQKDSVRNFVTHTEQIINSAQQHFLKINPERKLRTCLWGFSQGGAASLTYTLLGNHTLFKVASICGFLPELPDSVIEKKEPLDILGIFGSNDEVVPSFLADHALDEMKLGGVDDVTASHQNIFLLEDLI